MWRRASINAAAHVNVPAHNAAGNTTWPGALCASHQSGCGQSPIINRLIRAARRRTPGRLDRVARGCVSMKMRARGRSEGVPTTRRKEDSLSSLRFRSGNPIGQSCSPDGMIFDDGRSSGVWTNAHINKIGASPVLLCRSIAIESVSTRR